MDHKERFHATIERKEVDRPACWLGMPVPEACENLFKSWKKTQKRKKNVSSDEIGELLENTEKIPGTDIKIVIGKTKSNGMQTAIKITENKDYIVHIFDGDKLISMASENIDIDLRKIVDDISKILGGGGGGKPKMIQCGGPNKEKADEALVKAKQLTIKLLKK